jgi:hypothetical protein
VALDFFLLKKGFGCLKVYKRMIICSKRRSTARSCHWATLLQSCEAYHNELSPKISHFVAAFFTSDTLTGEIINNCCPDKPVVHDSRAPQWQTSDFIFMGAKR